MLSVEERGEAPDNDGDTPQQQPVCAFARVGDKHLSYSSLCYLGSLTSLSFYPSGWTTRIGIQQIVISH